MYAISEFEDAIDDCVSGSNSNGGSSGPVHACDQGVAFFVGSVMRTQFEMVSHFGLKPTEPTGPHPDLHATSSEYRTAAHAEPTPSHNLPMSA